MGFLCLASLAPAGIPSKSRECICMAYYYITKNVFIHLHILEYMEKTLKCLCMGNLLSCRSKLCLSILKSIKMISGFADLSASLFMCHL